MTGRGQPEWALGNEGRGRRDREKRIMRHLKNNETHVCTCCWGSLSACDQNGSRVRRCGGGSSNTDWEVLEAMKMQHRMDLESSGRQTMLPSVNCPST